MANPAKRTVLVIAVIAVVVAPSRAQMSPAARPKFEVASIKLCRPGDAPLGGGRSGANGNDPGRLHLTCQTLDGFIRMAYIRFASVDANGMSTASTRVRNQPIAGEPDWANSERYSIDAKPESPQNLATMNGPMLQTLLEDRFQLRIRHEAKDVPVYQLVVGRGGPKLTPTTKASCTAVSFSQDAAGAAKTRRTSVLRSLPARQERRHRDVRADAGRPLPAVFGSRGSRRRRSDGARGRVRHPSGYVGRGAVSVGTAHFRRACRPARAAARSAQRDHPGGAEARAEARTGESQR